MEPTIPVGSLLVAEETEIESVGVGDIVCFRSRSADMMGKIITHRVVDITESESGERLLVTKGDANLVQDAQYVDAYNLIGTVKHATGNGNLLSDIVAFLTSQTGFTICIALPVMLISGHILKNCVGSMKGDMKKIVDQIVKEDKEKEEKEKNASDQANSADQTIKRSEPIGEGGAHDYAALGIDQAEYKAMCERIKAELMAELKEELKKRGEEGDQSE